MYTATFSDLILWRYSEQNRGYGSCLLSRPFSHLLSSPRNIFTSPSFLSSPPTPWLVQTVPRCSILSLTCKILSWFESIDSREPPRGSEPRRPRVCTPSKHIQSSWLGHRMLRYFPWESRRRHSRDTGRRQRPRRYSSVLPGLCPQSAWRRWCSRTPCSRPRRGVGSSCSSSGSETCLEARRSTCPSLGASPLHEEGREKRRGGEEQREEQEKKRTTDQQDGEKQQERRRAEDSSKRRRGREKTEGVELSTCRPAGETTQGLMRRRTRAADVDTKG